VLVQSLLRTIRRLEDLRALVRAAGHAPLFQWLPPDGWADPPPRRAAVVGRHESFEWLAFETEQPVALAARLARRLETAGRLAGILTLCPAARVLALSVSLPPRPVLVVELDTPSRLALAALAQLAGAEQNGALGAAAHLVRSLDAEAVGRRFFATFRDTLHAFANVLPPRMTAADRHALALLQLTRVLFLYFVQARGWLDGRPAFLREQVDRTLAARRPLHRDLLRPLFFGTLNQPPHRRGTVARSFGNIPFLNGGLFEPHPLERRWRADIPTPAWRDAFDSLFERFRFTVEESDGAAIAPDMLGRVFEGVMDPEERSDSGTFYTPVRLVEAVVRATLAAWLARRLACDDATAERRLVDPDPATRDALAAITILDPAVGSGAFLLGALDLLSHVMGGPRSSCRRAILARSLFGVDRNPAAVRLTELRLWLALIADDSASDPAAVAPLPNLDSVVRQGDSLLDPLSPGWCTHPPAREARALTALRRALHQADNADKPAALRALRQAEVALAAAMLRQGEAAARTGVADLLTQARSLTLFGTQRGLDRHERRALETLRQRRRFLWSMRRALERDGTLPWFHFHSNFADVFTAGGFDVVLGNPPWVRAEHLPFAVRKHLRLRYAWWRVPGAAGPGYAHQPDLSIAFLERAVELLRPGGVVGFLMPAKLASAAYAGTARAALAERTTLHAVADLTGDPRAAFDATAYPLALIAAKTDPPPGHRVRLRLEPATPAELPQRRLDGGPWILRPGRVSIALDRLRADHPTVGARFRCHLGVKTGLNDVFLDPPDPIEPELLWWAVRGRDVHAFGVRPCTRLLWTHAANGDPLPALPPLARAYLARHRQRLVARRDYHQGPAWTLFRTGAACRPHRVVWADLAVRLDAAALTGPGAERLIPLNTCYVLPMPDAPAACRLAAWFNCTWIRAAAALTADPAANGFRRFNARVVGALPLPVGVLHDATLSHLAEAGREGRLIQEELDAACARHLALSIEDQRALADVPARRRHRR
jgi:hypothetical protein